MRFAEIVFGVAAILLAALFFALSGSFPNPRGGDVGMAFYPRVLAVIITLLSLTIIVQAVLKRRAENGAKDDGTTGGSTDDGDAESEGEAGPLPLFELKDGGFYRVLIMIALTMGYQQVLRYLGFLIVTPIYLIILMLVFRAGTIWKVALVSVLTTAIVYIAFQRFLQIPLPTGIFYN